MPKPRQVISFSEMSKLAQCEQRWDYQYEHKPDIEMAERARALQLGSILHAGIAAWWKREPWLPALEAIATSDEFGLTGVPEHSDPWNDAIWLLERYAAHYGPDGPAGDWRDRYSVVAEELELTAVLPGTRTKVMGFIDNMLIDNADGSLWPLERKSMSGWERLDQLPVDLQVSAYAWLVRENGYAIRGFAYDAIRTYRWVLQKPTQTQLIEERSAVDEEFAGWTLKAQRVWAKAEVERHPGVEAHPPSESFNWLWLDRTDEQMNEAVREFAAVSRRRTALRRKGARPLHNIGPLCKRCDFRDHCYERLAFPPYAITIEED